VISAQFLRRDPYQMGLLAYGESKAKQENPVIEAGGIYLREAICTRQFWIYCVILITFSFCFSVVLVHSVIHAIGLGMTPASAANILAIIGIAGIISRLAFGRLADIIGMKLVLTLSFVLMSVAFLNLAMAGEIWMIYLFAAIYGISYAVFEILMSPIMAELFGLSSLGTITGVSFAIGGTGFIFGPVVSGYIFDISGSYQVAFLICAAMAIIATIFAALLPLTRSKPSFYRTG